MQNVTDYTVQCSHCNIFNWSGQSPVYKLKASGSNMLNYGVLAPVY